MEKKTKLVDVPKELKKKVEILVVPSFNKFSNQGCWYFSDV